MTVAADVRIVGGGIIGLTSAYLLARAGVRVELCDRRGFGQEASWAGAGILPPGVPEQATTPLDRLRAESVSGFEAFSAELLSQTGLHNGYLRCGGLELLEPHELHIPALWAAEGLPAQRVASWHEPIVLPTTLHTFHLPGFAQVRNPWHIRALIAACEALGVILRHNTALEELNLDSKQQTVFALGAWSGTLFQQLGMNLPVVPMRGQILLLKPHEPVFRTIVLVGKRYLVPRADGRVLIGSTEEPEAGFVKATTEVAIAELHHFATQLCPSLADATWEKAWAGLRPATPDGLPYLGTVPHHPNWFVATGHFRAGVQLSLSTARIVRDWATGTRVESQIQAFRFDRIPHKTIPSAFRS